MYVWARSRDPNVCMNSKFDELMLFDVLDLMFASMKH